MIKYEAMRNEGDSRRKVLLAPFLPMRPSSLCIGEKDMVREVKGVEKGGVRGACTTQTHAAGPRLSSGALQLSGTHGARAGRSKGRRRGVVELKGYLQQHNGALAPRP